MYRIETELKRIAVADLRPTQMTVGFKEVRAKQKSWAKLDGADREKSVREEFFPRCRDRARSSPSSTGTIPRWPWRRSKRRKFRSDA